MIRAVILQTSHGRRSIDVLKILCPERANWECKQTSFPSLFLKREHGLIPAEPNVISRRLRR
jgi:hypothetical protein